LYTRLSLETYTNGCTPDLSTGLLRCIHFAAGA
jgi:hypothetical protein